MKALIDLSSDKKVREVSDAPRNIQPGFAILEITYEDRPTFDPETQVAERQEARVGKMWVKSWLIRDKTANELTAHRQKKRRQLAAEIQRIALVKVARKQALADGVKASLLPPDEDYPR